MWSRADADERALLTGWGDGGLSVACSTPGCPLFAARCIGGIGASGWCPCCGGLG